MSVARRIRHPRPVQSNPGNHQNDTGDIPYGGDLREHQNADHGGGGRQQRDHQRVRGARQPGHECHRVSGEDCFLVKVHVPAIEDLEGVLDQFLLYGQTTSSFVVATPVPPRMPGRL